jgi:hypothetical protein
MTLLEEESARRTVRYLYFQHRKQTSIHTGGTRTRNSSKRAAADPRLTARSNQTPVNNFWKAARKIYLDFLATCSLNLLIRTADVGLQNCP